MSIQTLQEFIGRSMVASAGLTALGAALDAKVSGKPLDPALAYRVQALLASVGAGALLDDIGPQEATILRGMIRAMYLLDGKLLFERSRTKLWDHVEPEILQSVGEYARIHALTATREVVPALDGVAERFHAPGAAMLDVGVGVGESAISMAQMWPELRIVGIDPWEPSLKLARENVDRAGLNHRFELRLQGVESLEDQSAFDLVWFAVNFIPAPLVKRGLPRVRDALRPGGWVMTGATNPAAPAPAAALMQLRETMWGGPVWTVADAERELREAGFAEVRVLPVSPTVPVAMLGARRRPA
jgi:predicted O-methyltransferase YrrM